MRVAVWGTGLFASYAYSIISRVPFIEVVYFVETKKSKEAYNGIKVIDGETIDFKDFDALVIAVSVYNEILDFLMRKLPYYEEVQNKIYIYPKDFKRLWSFFNQFFPFYSCLADGCVFLARNTDTVIIRDMLIEKRTFSADIIDLFFRLSEEYYGKDDKTEGCFLDIGANIGTTSIYVKKNRNAKLHIVAFEAAKENFDMLRVNCILNGTEDIIIENLGLADKRGELRYRYIPANPGGTALIDIDNDSENSAERTNIISIIPLDEYIAEKQIKDIAYIWMDVEGMEAEIIKGAMNILRERKIPLLQEFNPIIYIRKNTFSDYIENMNEIYDGFIDTKEYIAKGKIEHGIEELQTYHDRMKQQGHIQTDLFFF